MDGLCDVVWPADRDFLNDDGGWIVIFDAPDEFELPLFGLPSVTVMEGCYRIRCGNGQTWWHCIALANNETSIDYAFNESVAPPAVLAQLLTQVDE